MYYVKLTKQSDGQPMDINFENVLRYDASGTGSKVFFVNNDFELVKESPAQILELLTTNYPKTYLPPP